MHHSNLHAHLRVSCTYLRRYANLVFILSALCIVGVNAQTTYYWVAGSSALFNDPATWNTAPDGSGTMRSVPASTDILIVDGAMNTPGAPITDAMLQTSVSIGVLRITNSTAFTAYGQISTRNISITGGTGDDLDIQSGSTLTLNGGSIAGTTAVTISFSGTNLTGNIAGTLTFGGLTANAVTTTGGTGTLVTVSGTVNLATPTNALVGSTSTLTFANGSQCNSSGATTGAPPVPLATWGATSNLNISGLTTSLSGPPNGGQTFGNINWNCPGATSGTVNFFGSNIRVIQGNLNIIATGGTQVFRCVTSGMLTVNGNMTISGSSSCDIANAGGTVTVNGKFIHTSSGIVRIGVLGLGTLVVLDSLKITTGTIDLATGSSSQNGTIRSSGVFFQSGGTITESGTSTASTIEFAGTSAIQNVTLGTITNRVSYRVNNNFGISVTGTMTITDGTSLRISSLASSPITGTVVYSGTSTTLTYDGADSQTTTDNVWPVSGAPTFIIINSAGAGAPFNRVYLHASRNFSGIFSMISGVFVLGNNDLIVGGTVSGTATNTNFIATNGTGQVIQTYLGAGSKTYPLGDITGTDEASPVTLNFTTLNSGSATVGVRVTDAHHPDDPSASEYLSRYYSFTRSGTGIGSYTLTLNYPSSDVAGDVTMTKLNRWDGTSWMKASGAVPGATSVVASGLLHSTLDAIADFTLRPITISTFTWKGGASGFYNTTTSWNPARTVLDDTDIMLFDGSNINGSGGTGNITVNGMPTQTIGKIILVNNANVNLVASTASNALTLFGSAGIDLDVPVGSTLTLSGTGTNTMGLSYSGSGNTASIAGTLNLGSGTGTGMITYNFANAITTMDGIVNSGTSTAASAVNTATASNLLVNGTWNHKQNGGTIPTATYALTSNVNVTGITTLSPIEPSVIGGKFTWNNVNQNTAVILNILSSIGGACTIQSTGLNTLQFNAGLTVGGLFSATGGQIFVNNVTLNGSLTVSPPASLTVNAPYVMIVNAH